MQPITRTLAVACLFLAVAAAAPAAEADPAVVCVDGACQSIDADSLVPTIMGCEPILGCYSIHPTLPEVGGSCSASGDGSGVRVECHGS